LPETPVNNPSSDFAATPPAPRVRDLPELLAGLPRLSESEAGELANDLDRAREELNRRARRSGS